ncbi:hypothetical protein KY348_06685 [Candidatus Woesearchaeota archaeon]|nr:hypothetical protein [Candidatus Woesearchaeota archaeon]
MKPILFVCIAVLLYSITNLVIEQKLSQYDTASLLVFFYIVMLPLAFSRFLYVKHTKPETVFPSGKVILIALGIGFIYFFADYFYVGAFSDVVGGKLIMITSLFITFPVVASVMKYFWTRKLPNIYHVIAYLLAVLAVLFALKGNSLLKQ